MAYTNIKTEIDGKIYTNILREITGDILNEVLKKMVDSLGKGYRYMGILEPDGSRPSGDENMFMVATEAGYYTALADDIPSGITICSFSEGSIRVETILNLDEIFSGNHSWGGNNTFNGFTQFQNEVDVSFENVYDLEDGETLSNKLASLVTAIATKISKVTGAVEDNLATFDENGNVKDSGVSVDDLAKKDGISEKLVSGSSRGILSPSAIEELFLFQRTANGAGGTGAAVFQSIKGNSIVWNQLIKIPSSRTTITVNGVTFTDNRDGTYTVQTDEGGATAHTNFQGFALSSAVGNSLIGHKVLLIGAPNGSSASTYYMRSLAANDYGEGGIGTPTNTESGWPRIYVNQGTIITTPVVFRPQFFDLTLMFGAGKEPTSVADFTKFYNLPYYAPNSGAIKNNCATGMVTDGFNQWDEEYLFNGVSPVDGTPDGWNDRICSKNFIPAFPSTAYYFKMPMTSYIFCYDKDKTFLGLILFNGVNYISAPGGIGTTLPNTAFIKFSAAGNAYGPTYNHDICISISGARNGQYEPHWSDTTALPITTATGKLNGEGESVVLCPEGARSAGSVYDEFVIEKGFITKFIKRIGVVDLGTLTWSNSTPANSIFRTLFDEIPDIKPTPNTASLANAISARYTQKTYTALQQSDNLCFCVSDAVNSKVVFINHAYTDVDTFKTAMSGVMMNYELATPEEYILDTPVPVVARVDENGTQTILPQGVDENGTPMTAPFNASIQYPVKLGVAPIGQQSLVNLLEKMKSAEKIASYTMVWDAANGAYDFTIS